MRNQPKDREKGWITWRFNRKIGKRGGYYGGQSRFGEKEKKKRIKTKTKKEAVACMNGEVGGGQMLVEEDKGKTKVGSLAEALPSLQQAMALSLPCREMCEAVQASCGCGQARTFGELLDAYVHAVRPPFPSVPQQLDFF
jgi:hypothetical protein